MKTVLAGIVSRFALLALCLAPALASAAKLPMWEIRDPATGGTVYLLGSIHVCKASCLNFPPTVMQRFNASSALAVELDPTQPETVLAIQRAMLLPEQETVWNRLDGADFSALHSALSVAGLSPEKAGRVRPPLLAAMMSAMVWEKLGYSQRFGVDQWFMTHARSAGKPIRELESIEQQLNALLSGSEQDQMRALLHDADTIVSGRAERYMDALIAAWQSGDLHALDKLTLEEFGDYPAIHNALLLKRNQGMSTKIAQWLRQGEQVFVIVGAAHIAGTLNIADILSANGFTARQLSDTD